MCFAKSAAIFLILVIAVGPSDLQPHYQIIQSAVTREEVIGDEALTACVFETVTRYFEVGSTVAVVLPEFQDQSSPITESIFGDLIVRKLHETSVWSLVNLDLQSCFDLYLHYHTNDTMFIPVDDVLILGDVEQIVDFMEDCDIWSLVGEKSHFVVALESTDVEDEAKDVKQVLDIAWKSEYQDVVVLVKTEHDVVRAYSWFPVRMDTKPVIFDVFSNGIFRYNVDLFPNKVPSDLMGYKVRFGVMTNPPYLCKKVDGSFGGVEAKIAEAVAQELNFSLRYDFFGVFGYRGWTMALAGLGERTTDVAMGGFLERVDRFEKFGHTLTLMSDTLEWFVTGDAVTEALIKPQAIAVGLSHLSAMLLFVAAMMFFTFMKRSSDTRTATSKESDTAWLLVWAVFFEAPFVSYKLGAYQKLIWALMACFVIVMNTLLKSVLTSIMSFPKVVPRILTIHDLVESDIPLIYAGPPSSTVAFPDENYNATQITARVMHCPHLACITGTLLHSPIAITAPRNFMGLLENWAPKPIFHMLDRPITGIHLTTYTRRNYFLLPAMRRLMRRLSEAGLTHYWRYQFQRNPGCEMSLTDLRNFYNPHILSDYLMGTQDRVTKESQIGTFGASFRILLRGHVVSSLIFIYELIKAYRYRCHALFVARLGTLFTRYCKRPKNIIPQHIIN